jgi:hypothetical protein
MSQPKTIALVTGASSGIGAEFCRQLADRCDRIIATGRRDDRLRQLAAELADRCEVVTVAADLATLEGRIRVIEALRQRGPVDYLVNNAGFSTLGKFAGLELDAQQDMVRVHIDATLALCRAAIPYMAASGRGYIVNVSSVAAFVPFARSAVYGATKAFLNHFSEALQAEVADSGIKVQSLCPGFTRSEFHARDAMKEFDTGRVAAEQWMEAPEVVSASLAALEREAVIVVPGAVNQATVRGALQKSRDAI